MVAQALRQASQRLEQAGCQSPLVDSELLLAAALGLDRSALRRAIALAKPLAELADQAALARFNDWLERRMQREPLQW
ncbi:MAG: hypothetical protein LBG70_03435, partial [Bifidobacteriaceae bacterium]|nr:hypothetical protein [Bifidobacteriaceae bacterium]